jgi:disulfide bond formation protein DsbB
MSRNPKNGVSTVSFLLRWIDQFPRRVFAGVFLVCVGMLLFGAYLQHVVGLEPCPMCIVQRYAMILVAACAVLASLTASKRLQIGGGVCLLVLGSGGAFVAARQSWLQWYPPAVASCGRDLYGMIESFPLQRVIPMLFKGSGDCSAVDWTFLGGTIANWSFLWFCVVTLVGAVLAWRQWHRAV